MFLFKRLLIKTLLKIPAAFNTTYTKYIITYKVYTIYPFTTHFDCINNLYLNKLSTFYHYKNKKTILIIFFVFFSFLSNNLYSKNYNSKAKNINKFNDVNKKNSQNLIVFLYPGKRKTFYIKPYEKVWADTSQYISIKDKLDYIQITAKKLGTTKLKIGSRSYEIYVIKKRTYQTYKKLKNITSTMMGLNIEMIDKKVFLSGELLRVSDWKKIAQDIDPDLNEYYVNFLFHSTLKSQILNYLQNILQENYLPLVNFKFKPYIYALIPKNFEHLKKQFHNILATYGIATQIAPNILGTIPMVKVNIVVMELKKKSFQHFGLKWPSSFNAKIIPQKNFILNGDNIDISLNAIEENGLGKILASPTLLCRSGKEANFLAGGEIPLKIINQHTHDVIWKKYGILLSIKPEVDFSGKMSIEITTEVSMLDNANSSNGIPGLITNRIKSHFDLNKEGTIFLSGLIKKDWGKSSSGTPLLSKIPIIGSLFSSQDFRNNKTELVFLVSPKIQEANNIDFNSEEISKKWDNFL